MKFRGRVLHSKFETALRRKLFQSFRIIISSTVITIVKLSNSNIAILTQVSASDASRLSNFFIAIFFFKLLKILLSQKIDHIKILKFTFQL